MGPEPATAENVEETFLDHAPIILSSQPRRTTPQRPLRIQSQRPSVRAMLSAKDVLELYHAATVRFRSVILFKWQSFMYTARLLYANEHCSDQIVEQIQAGTLPVHIDLPGRKGKEMRMTSKANPSSSSIKTQATPSRSVSRNAVDDPRKANPKAINKRNEELRSDVTKLTQDLEQVKLQLSSAKIAPVRIGAMEL